MKRIDRFMKHFSVRRKILNIIDIFMKWATEYGSAIEAISTLIATVIAVVGIVLSYISIQSSNAANEISREQFTYSKSRDRENEIRAQAVLVSAWMITSDVDTSGDSRHLVVNVRNGDTQPVYDGVISTGAIQGAAPELFTGEYAVPVGTIPPGEYQVTVPRPPSGMGIRFNASIGFTDSAGISWTRDAKGQLKQIKKHPYEFFKIPMPVQEFAELSPVQKKHDSGVDSQPDGDEELG